MTASEAFLECAEMLQEAAIGLYGGRKRINQVDTHVAEVLRSFAFKMLARSGDTRRIEEGQ